MTDHTPGQSETDPLAALRQLVDGMTPQPWVIHHDSRATIIRGQNLTAVCGLARFPNGERLEETAAIAAAIVAGSRALRLLADEATVGGVARLLCSTQGRYPVEDWSEWLPEARSILAHLAAQIVKEPQP